MISAFSTRSKCRIKDFASMIGSLISVCPAVQYGFLYTKTFEREKLLALTRTVKNYTAKLDVSSHLSDDFRWWINAFSDPNQVNIIRSEVAAREIFSDASLLGWGATYEGFRTHGWWSEKEKSDHINILELKAAFYALKCFASDLSNCDILLRLNNTTAISCINCLGSVQCQ